MSVRSRVELLRQIPLFSDAADAHLQLLAFAMERVSIPAGRQLIVVGEQRKTAYIIADGSAKIEYPTSGDAPQLIGTGACVGELSMLADLPYGFTVVALTDLDCLQLTRDLFYRVAEEFPDFAEITLEAITRRVDTTSRDLQHVARLLNQARPFSSLPQS